MYNLVTNGRQPTVEFLDFLFGGDEAYEFVSENEKRVKVRTPSMVNFRDFEDAEERGYKFYQVHATKTEFGVPVLEFVFSKMQA